MSIEGVHARLHQVSAVTVLLAPPIKGKRNPDFFDSYSKNANLFEIFQGNDKIKIQSLFSCLLRIDKKK